MLTPVERWIRKATHGSRLPHTRPRKYERHQPPWVCECGMTLKRRQRHYASVYHVNALRIRALLQQDCLTFLEIGKRLGISKERVRQIAENLKMPDGFARMKSCTTRTREAQPLPARIERIIKKAVLQGITHKILWGVGEKRRLSGSISLNGFLCGLRKAWIINLRGYCRIARLESGCDFVLWELADGRWLILPKEKQPKAATMFTLHPTTKRGCHTDRHDYRSYIEAWDLLRLPAQPLQ